MTRAEIIAYNAGVAALAAIADAAAAALRAKLIKAPTRFSLAIAALEGVAEAAADVMLPPPPSGDKSAAGAIAPRPTAPTSGGIHVVVGAA